ncbi:MAG: TIGR00645 family protein [Actinobacteria bacterium]|uniref:Unannotated protein n=1 Tax=freshwater metagenome TaxID=449393 RepID=A0A6J7S7E6_9ZZZZ|nr:TIGR00645 family protein [Actinomycetota bacterium]
MAERIAPKEHHNGLSQAIAWTIFSSRWLQAPLYLGLIVAQLAYVVEFGRNLYTLISQVGSLDETAIMMLVLGLVDVVMVANLLVMVIVGGYETFVSRIAIQGHRDEPEWLSHVNANVLKTKLAMAIIGISSIRLLRSFIESSAISTETLMWQVFIHLTFIVSALALAFIDRMSRYDAAVAHANHAVVPAGPPAAGAQNGAHAQLPSGLTGA